LSCFVVLFLLIFTIRVSPLAAQDEINALINSMTLEQKVGQLFMVTLHGAVMTGDGAAFLRTWQPGAISIFSDNVTTPENMTTLTNNFQETIIAAGGIPLIIAVDQEGGVVQRLPPENGFTFFPTPMLMNAAGADMAQQMGIAVAEELSAVGINMNLAPVADLETNPNNPIIARRSFGSDPEMVGSSIAGFIQGSQLINVMTVAKHFPGHGETSEDSHATLPRIDLPLDRVETIELVPFRAAIEANVAAIMVGHLWYPALDPTPNMPASLSPVIITDLLRGELGYDGIVITDAMDMNAVDLTYNFYDAVLMAVEAGADILALGPSTGLDVASQAMQTVIDAVNSRRIPESRIDESVRRILTAKQQYGLFNWQPLDSAATQTRLRLDSHAALIEDLYQEAVTVAYDHGELVPVNSSGEVAIIFLATRYQIQQECSQYTDPERTRWVGVGDAPSNDEISWAVSAANAADTVIVFTQNAYRIPEQQALVNALPQERTIAVAIWSPYDWQRYPNVGAYMVTYSPARPAVPAACAAIFGAVPASGRLAITLGEGLPAGSFDQN